MEGHWSHVFTHSFLALKAQCSGENEIEKDFAWASASPPSIPLATYVERITELLDMDKASTIIAFIYVDRLLNAKGLLLNDCNIHRIVLVCLIWGHKWLEDISFSYQYLARVGGVTKKQLFSMEHKFMSDLSFNVHVNQDTYENYENIMITLWTSGNSPSLLNTRRRTIYKHRSRKQKRLQYWCFAD